MSKRVRQLRKASSLVRAVCATLDSRKAPPCTECEIQRHVNWTEAQALKELSAAATKIERNANALEDAGQKRQAPAGG